MLESHHDSSKFSSAKNVRDRSFRIVVGCFTLASLTFLLVGCGVNNEEGERQQQVRAAGEVVMPFELDATTHHFVVDPTGGTQTVIANDSTDRVQVRLVRVHLREISEKFTKGDFSDPSSIHGSGMAGIDILSRNAGKLQVSYVDIEGGGRITYQSQDSRVVEALHSWFNAQLSDHGSDASASEPDDAKALTFEELHQLHHPASPPSSNGT